MNPCNYIPFEAANIDPSDAAFDDLFDLDILCTEEGIFINIANQQ
jgi:hypothetical protein